MKKLTFFNRTIPQLYSAELEHPKSLARRGTSILINLTKAYEKYNIYVLYISIILSILFYFYYYL